MSNQIPLRQVWTKSRGIVFAGGNPVTYPRLPSVRFSSSPALATAGPQDGDPFPSGRPEPFVPSRPLGVSIPKLPDALTRLQPSVESTQQKDDGVDDVDCVPPYTPLEYTIPEDVFRNAKRAEPGSPESFWSYRLYRGPGQDAGTQAKVPVHYCKSMQTTERVLQNYFMHEKLVGFDLEWDINASVNHGPRRNICLVQLASPSRIALFHLALYPKHDDLVAPSLKKLMEDPNITKVGVWIKGDCTRLKNFLGIEARGLFELSHLYRLVKFSTSGEFNMINRRLVALAAQAEEYLKLPLFKGQDVRAGDWAQPLQMDQIVYAASDAYAGVHLYAIMDHLRENLNPTPPLPYHAELGKPIRIADGVTLTTKDEVLEEPRPQETGARPLAAGQSLNMFHDSIKIEPEDDATAAAEATNRSTKDSRVLGADVWVSNYRISNPKMKAGPSALRSYYMWHKNDDLSPEALAALLRDPPLQTTTVVTYILEAIRLEKLAYDPHRLKTDVLDLLPSELVMRRYKSIAKACETAAEHETGKTEAPDNRNRA